MMTKEDCAAQLNGSAYPFSLSRATEQRIQSEGLVVVYGDSDDRVELRGAIHNEVDAWEGATFLVTPTGLWDENSCPSHCHFYEQAFTAARNHGQQIIALWNPGDGYAWRFETQIPHATFEITEGGAPYCRGLVFVLNEITHDL